MTIETDPKIVREIARKFLTDPHTTPGDVKASIRNHIGSDASAETFAAWWDAVEADVRKGKVETVATWPDEESAAEQDSPSAQRLKAAVAKANAEAPPLAMRILRNAYQHLLALNQTTQRVVSVTAMLEMLNPEQFESAEQDDEFRLRHGGAWCTACHRAMREGTLVVKVPAVVCKPCAADLAETGGRLDPSRLNARDAKGAL